MQTMADPDVEIFAVPLFTRTLFYCIRRWHQHLWFKSLRTV